MKVLTYLQGLINYLRLTFNRLFRPETSNYQNNQILGTRILLRVAISFFKEIVEGFGS